MQSLRRVVMPINVFRTAPRMAALLWILATAVSLAGGASAAPLRGVSPSTVPEAASPGVGISQAPAGPRSDVVTTSPVWTFESNLANAELGVACAVAGDVNRDGFDDIVAFAVNGRFYLFLGGPGGPSLAPGYPITVSGGVRLNGAGDLNGDGYADVVIGGPGPAGFIRIYYGNSSGLDLAHPFTVSRLIQFWGDVVGSAGDVNGDGYGDLIVGTPSANGSGCSGGGLVDVFYGSATGITSTTNWFLDGCRWVGGGGGLGAAA